MGQRPRKPVPLPEPPDAGERDEMGARPGCQCGECVLARALWFNERLRVQRQRSRVLGVRLMQPRHLTPKER